MKIAVTYDNGSVFQHFGKTENFKIFEVENGAIISSEVVSSNGAAVLEAVHRQHFLRLESRYVPAFLVM